MNSRVIFLFILCFGITALPCTAFLNSTSQRFVVAKNFDWNLGHGLLMVNKQNVQKVALFAKTTDMPLMWTSKYGSVTFNQLGRELPYGGMNERGLVVEILWLDETEYPAQIPEVMEANESQWVQSMLDRAQTIGEMISLSKGFQVNSRHGKVHYFACDSSGTCAVFEYLKGKLVITKLDNKNDVKAISNNSYEESLEAFKASKKFPEDPSSLSRFTRAATLIKRPNTSEALVPATFKILDAVSDDETKWSIVYDPSLSKIFFKTKSRPDIKEVSLNYFDWSCGASVKVLDINTASKQDVSSTFEDYSDKLNTSIVEKNNFLPKDFFKSMETAPARDHCI
jgi:penicillin V acylase-like amidase (Ntn superfamily)